MRFVFFDPTVDLATGCKLVYLKGSGSASGGFRPEGFEGDTLGLEVGCARGEYSEADEAFSRLIRNYAGTPVIYTDGSKVDGGRGGGAGLGIFSPDLGLYVSLTAHGSLSIFAIESIAILNAINIIEESGCTRAFIVSDSRSALHAVLSPDTRGGKH